MSRFEGKPVGFFVLVVAVVLGMVVCAFSFVSASSRRTALEDVVSANATNIQELQAEYDRLSGSTSTVDDKKNDSVSPVAVGRAVATYQNRYYDMRVNTLSSEPTEYETVIESNAKALRAYLESDSQAASGVWFACDDLTSRFQWSFRSGYVCEGEEMSCLWTCEDKNSALVAFAVGTYRASTNKFGDVHVYVTQYGLSTYQAAGGQATVFDDSYLESVTSETSVPVEPDVSNPLAHVEPEGSTGDSSAGASSGGFDTWAAQMEQQFRESDAYREQMKQKEG